MTNTDKEYVRVLEDILKNGKEKESRAGKTLSVFGRQIRFDLKEGIPMLTTKKFFYRGILHELLWFLNKSFNPHRSMNIEYLIRNNVHIWDDDAYRWFKEWVKKEIITANRKNFFFYVAQNDDYGLHKTPSFEWWIENDLHKGDIEWLKSITKEMFLDLVAQRVEMRLDIDEEIGVQKVYRFGDLGPIYGKQWRAFGTSETDQIQNIIDALKTDPSNRRLVCLAYNPDVLNRVALPPCHVMMQFWTRKLTLDERVEAFNKRNNMKETVSSLSEEDLNNTNTPKYGLSCMWTQRSGDWCLGVSSNIFSYGTLTYMIAKLVNMVPDELIGSIGDCHIYMNQMDGVQEQLNRKGSDVVPKLLIHGDHKSIEDFEFGDFEIVDYNPDPPIKFPLSVGDNLTL